MSDYAFDHEIAPFTPKGEYPNQYNILEGHDPNFMPGGLRAPDWAIIINPNGYDDAESEEFELNEDFSDPDVYLAIIDNADLIKVQQALRDQARVVDRDDHVEDDNGAAYLIWKLPNGQLALAGMDNGGSQTTQTSVAEIAARMGTIVKQAHASHFRVQHACGEAHTGNNARLLMVENIVNTIQTPVPAAPKRTP